MSTSTQYGIDISEQIKLFAEIGFDAFFTGWNRELSVPELVKTAREYNMIYQSIHAPFGKSAHMWGEDKVKGDIALDELTACLECCCENEVPIMIAHAFLGFEEHNPTQSGIERFGALVRRAEECGVKIAFENTEGEEYLEALMDNFSGSPAVGFCWDCGHEMCYNHSRDWLGIYGDRLIATHLNDNLGIRDYNGNITFIDDLHLLPFDGIADWDDIASRLVRCGFDDTLTFELNTQSKPGRRENDIYAAMPFEQYATEAYKRACRFASKMH
ncbi:MAG: TIM barrel protein [Clostridiales bacterium]|nr:TIM barrel protein [Clostridiales bacterium]